MVKVMTTHLPPSLVAHAAGELFGNLTATQTVTPAPTSSCGPRPKPTFDPARTRTVAPCRESWCLGGNLYPARIGVGRGRGMSWVLAASDATSPCRKKASVTCRWCGWGCAGNLDG